MKGKSMVVLGLAMVVFAIGCAQGYKAYQVGPKEVHVVNTWHLFSPSSTDVFTLDTETQEVARIDGGINSGVLGIVAMPVATVAAAHEIGKGLRDSGDEINSTVVNKSASASEGGKALSGSASGALAGDRSESSASNINDNYQSQSQRLLSPSFETTIGSGSVPR